MAATEAGIKDLAWNNVDGGTAAPSATVTTASTITGATIDLLDTGNGLLPDEVIFKFKAQHTTTTGTQSGSDTPTYYVDALWLAGTGSPHTPTVVDRKSHRVAAVADTTTVAGVTPSGTSAMGPTNSRSFPCLGRYLKLRYSINAAANIAGNLKFGAKWAPVYGKNDAS